MTFVPSPWIAPLLTRDEWNAIITWFLLEQSSQTIANKTGIERKCVLRALTDISRALVRDVPAVFSGTVEVDESTSADAG